jgi:hypothetical protein
MSYLILGSKLPERHAEILARVGPPQSKRDKMNGQLLKELPVSAPTADF